MASLRRSGARLLSLGSGHGDLIMTISQIKELRSATKALIAAEEATLDDLVRWSAKEENRAIKDVLERFSELCAFWTEAQKELNEQMKEVRSHFEMILEGEKGVDAAKGLVEAADAKEIKLRKEFKRLSKKSCPPSDELRDIEERIAKVQRDKDFSEHEASIKVKDHEAVKLIRLKEALKKFTSGQLALSEKNSIVFSAAQEVVHQIPDITIDMTDTDLQSIKYRGAPFTAQIVMRAKDDLKNFKPREATGSRQSTPTRIPARCSPTMLPSSPPAYDDIHNHPPQPPINPYYNPSSEVNENYDPNFHSPPVSVLYPNLNHRQERHVLRGNSHDETLVPQF